MIKMEALQELKRCSGKQFDPQVVSVFYKMMLFADACGHLDKA
ncbi:hypothetical protein [Dethiobacter alkaliphilus]|nr:hypothetical protein [Dethiobacter alkaliphilus]MCW3488799.1 hypothetical protein [Dethiobacter alkaliphilus]